MPQEGILRFPKGERQLFLDDAGIANMESLHRTMHQPDKKGAVIRQEPAIGGNPEIRSAPAWDPARQVWKLWTICVTPEELHGEAGLSGYHESRDGLHWYQPILRQAEYKGSITQDSGIVGRQRAQNQIMPPSAWRHCAGMALSRSMRTTMAALSPHNPSAGMGRDST